MASIRPKDKILVTPERRLILEWDAFFERLDSRVLQIETDIAAMQNAAAFYAQPSGDQSIPNSSTTLLTFGNETFDNNSNFSSSRFTVTVPGKYLLIAQAAIDGSALMDIWIRIRKNGGTDISGNRLNDSSISYPNVAVIDNAVAGDYYEVVLLQSSGASQNNIGSRSYFCGARIGT